MAVEWPDNVRTCHWCGWPHGPLLYDELERHEPNCPSRVACPQCLAGPTQPCKPPRPKTGYHRSRTAQRDGRIGDAEDS